MLRIPENVASPPNRAHPFLWALAYLAFGVFWILISDKVLLLLVGNLSEFSSAQTIKGIAYILVTTGLLYVILRRGLSALSRSEARLRAQSETLQSLVEASPVAITALDRERRLFLWSPAAERMFGWRRDEVLGQVCPLMVQQDEEEIEQLIKQAYEGRTLQGRERRLRRKDGSLIDVSISVAPLRSEDDHVIGLEVLFEDITERKRVERALAEERAFIDGALNALPDVLFVMSESGEMLRWNEQVRAVTGYTDLEIAGKEPGAFFGDRDADRIAAAIREVLEQGAASVEATIVTRQGRRIPYEFKASLLRNAAGEVLGICGIGRDVTERERAEQEIRKRNRELELLYTVGETFTRRLDAETLHRLILEAVVLAVPGAEAAALWLAHKTGKQPRLVAWTGFDEASMQRLAEAAEQPLVHLTRMSPKARRVATPEKELDVVPLDAKGQRVAQAFISVALVQDREPIGVLAAASFSSKGAFMEREGRLLQSLASKAAISIQNARLFENLRAMSIRLLEAQETERRRIAQELHDEMGGLLTSLKISLMMNPAEDDAARTALDESIELVDTMMDQMRRASLNLRPSMLDDLGLVAALDWFIDRFTARTQVAVDFRHELRREVRYAGEIETAAYRIVQEALTNVARHAEVDEAAVRLWRSDGQLHVEVSDEGRGFDLEQALQREEKFGVTGMRERAKLLGGGFSVETELGDGCRVLAQLPIGQDAT